MDRNLLLSLLGEMPRKVVLNLNVLEEVDCGTFIRKNSTRLKKLLAQKTGIQLDYVIPQFLTYGDLEDVVRLVEPCNLLILGTDEDRFSRNIEDIFEYAQSAFINGKLERQIYPGKHSFSREMRIRAYQFLADHLG
jgi:hypothetical protein